MAAPATPPGSDSTASVRLYTEGDVLYAAMLEAIAQARHSVKLESYIFAYDEVGKRFIEALTKRAAAGVQVQVYLDAAGSLFWGSDAVQNALAQGGVKVRWFRRWSWRTPLRYNRRNHRKLLVVDGARGFFGGFNIHRENSISVYGPARWRDTHLEVVGDLAWELDRVFDDFWCGRRRAQAAFEAADGSLLITNYSRRGRLFLRDLYAVRFAGAARRIWLTTPYLVPDFRTRNGLIRVARRGVDVRLLVPRKSDVWLAKWAAHAAYANLLVAGVKIYEYLPRMLHAKTVVVDEAWSCVGTANLDYRSFFLNYELNLASEDPELAAELARDFIQDLAQSEQIQPRRWARRGQWLRLLEVIGWAARHWL